MTFYVTQSLDGTINHCISGKYKVILLHLEMQFSDHSAVQLIQLKMGHNEKLYAYFTYKENICTARDQCLIHFLANT